MAELVRSTIQTYNISDRLFCITTDNASNNGKMRKDLQVIMDQMYEGLEEQVSWDSEATKIPCMAHVIQLVVKAMLGAFNVEPGEDPTSEDSIEPDLPLDEENVVGVIRKVSGYIVQ